MKHFLQSDLRKTLCSEIFGYKIFESTRFWEKVFGIDKTKKIWPLSMSRYQIQWIKSHFDHPNFKEELHKLKKQFGANRSNIFLQLCFIDSIAEFSGKKVADKDFANDIRQNRINHQNNMFQHFWLRTAFKENQPLSTISIDLNQSNEQIYNNFSSSFRNKIQKSLKHNIQRIIANESQRDIFYDLRYKTAEWKWFWIMKKHTFEAMKKYLLSTKQWNLFLSISENWEIWSWNICVFYWEEIIYLYWASNREFWNIWAHNLLQFETAKRWKENWFKIFDLFWWSPTWFANHSLRSVSEFKESTWWTKIEYLWNFDIVLNPLVYKMMKIYLGRG